MKKYLGSSLMLGVFLLVLAVMPLQSAYAWGVKGGYDHDRDWKDNYKKDCNTTSVPEPATLALLSSGIAGIGVYGLIKRKNRR
jgi:hypothetical protein